jgi:Asp-tRNA(Asn)/Glu-tRNA(Gln) amidotransferase A subunit family amidase
LITAKNVDVASAANLPAISLPSSKMSDKDNLPIGFELASLTGFDRKLISVARAVENVISGHHHQHQS